MSVSVRVTNHFKTVSIEVHARIAAATRKAAFDIEGRAKTKAPVDTGNLRNGINANGSLEDWRVDAPAEYAVYQEFGTRYQRGTPFLIPAREEVFPEYIAILKELAA